MAETGTFDDPADVPFTVLLPAFITSELKTAFEIGFLIFLPFLVIDMVIASILMSLGMMMLSPMLISLPFKLLLFVLVDGWAMTIGSLSATFMV
jgi:flagellar biosynthetic protein FliP